MKKLISLSSIVFSLTVGILNGQIGVIKYTSNGLDNTITADEVDPYIVIDEDNASYGLLFTRFAGTYDFDPYIVYATEGTYFWSSESIYPYGQNYEYLQSRMHLLGGGNRILSFRFASNFNDTNYYNSGTWSSMYDPNSGSWQNDYSKISFSHISFRDYATSSSEVHFLTICNYDNNIRTLKYFKRNNDGTYTNGYSVVVSNSLWQHPSLYDLTVGESNTPYFCYRVDDTLKVQKYQGDEITIANLYYDINPWNGKLTRMSPPTLAYNSQSGKVMIVYSDYDLNSGLWSLFYSSKDNESSIWSTPVKVFNNTEQATYPHIVSDKNSGDFFISFLSFDNSQQSNHIRLQVIGYVESESSFWEQPLEVADVGQIYDDGNQSYIGRPIHSVVLPYQTTTELLVSSLYFESDNDVDVRLYEVQFPSITTCTFRNIVVDEDAGDSLKLTNNATGSEETFTSGTSRNLDLDVNYTIETLPKRYEDYNYNGVVNDYQHHDWDGDDNRYKLSDDFDPDFWTTSKNAIYNSVSTVTLSSPTSSLSIHDPWYYDEATGTQPDDFRTISPGQYQVFLNQNPDFQPDLPIYSLRAPLLVNEGDGIYQVFHRWVAMKANGDTLSPTGIFEDEQSRQTRVVFTDSVATVEAEYFIVTLIGEGVNLSESSGNLILFAPEYIVINEIDVELFDSWTISPQGGATIT